MVIATKCFLRNVLELSGGSPGGMQMATTVSLSQQYVPRSRAFQSLNEGIRREAHF